MPEPISFARAAWEAAGWHDAAAAEAAIRSLGGAAQGSCSHFSKGTRSKAAFQWGFVACLAWLCGRWLLSGCKLPRQSISHVVGPGGDRREGISHSFSCRLNGPRGLHRTDMAFGEECWFGGT